MEAPGGEVTVLCMGPDAAAETVRKALSMGADKAIHVLDDGLHGSDAVGDVVGAGEGVGHDGVRPGDAGFGVLGCADGCDPGDAGRAAGHPQLTFAKEVTWRGRGGGQADDR